MYRRINSSRFPIKELFLDTGSRVCIMNECLHRQYRSKHPSSDNSGYFLFEFLLTLSRRVTQYNVVEDLNLLHTSLWINEKIRLPRYFNHTQRTRVMIWNVQPHNSVLPVAKDMFSGSSFCCFCLWLYIIQTLFLCIVVR